MSLTVKQEEDHKWALKLIDALAKHGTEPTTWEINFIVSLEDQIRNGRALSEKQLYKLRDIHADRVGK